MKSTAFLFVLLKSLTQYLQRAGDVLDEERRQRMAARAKYLEWERLRLEREVEQVALKQVQLLQLLAVVLLLVLVLVLWLNGWKSSLRREEDEEAAHGANEEEVGNVAANEEDNVGNEEEDGMNREEDNNDDGNVQEVGNVAANEEGNVANEAANAANNNAVAIVLRRDDQDFDDMIGRIVMERIQWPVQDLQKGCEWTTDLMDNYTVYFGHVLSNSFYPVLQRAIGVGSAFEGWSPREQDVMYRVFIPMTPPRGHSFHLELDSAEERPVRNFRVRVQLECTCTREEEGENMLCFLHCSEEELRRNQDPSLLDTLCTGSYLDVQKTARWFYQLVRAIWPALPQAHNWHLTPLPSTRSCQIKVTNGRESFRIEMQFGVRRDDSDIFVSGQTREGYTASTIWPESFAVAEMKFFKHIAKVAPRDSMHLKCLQFFTHLMLGFGFSTYTMKTIVMHLLNSTPVSSWRRRHLLQRLVDVSESLYLCVRAKRLNHFIMGNQRLPNNIRLPPDVERIKSYNLLQHLVLQPAAHAQATYECKVLQKWLKRIILDED